MPEMSEKKLHPEHPEHPVHHRCGKHYIILDKDGKPVAKIKGRILRVAGGYHAKELEHRKKHHMAPAPAPVVPKPAMSGDLSDIF